ncbi:hypothetical protein PHYBLDRAFT_176174 [Phycomyces blakesleeanus NRRL 1555(-)]|uniref:Uncharacterized protein n=1 Tax=Phycomyces blakesleeanus (strain ATCC 8743b / DSM 1359 / FGSC 10004 / NBRC 33097 / NRRL 1555) TaxID=763407 RepID=A0A162PG72_PHYB8|nr:hypothetical protein PHYBLDRAFT_176174 [Phycomyces blakesleeanus NRRL 1555(-)]OAD65406.1 hypothetical protein PHYBLDRAFT_176174 [Phycomyces blakesleeanus NRRL 1555(-)]|eukprot:XP_018283446.1 hypothetical protein PHYBLDRAFT_176174 [Phycomyces blakesleeanus NRRL 1555(-)]
MTSSHKLALGLPTKLAPYRSDTVYPAMIATTLSQYEYVLICDKSNIRVSGSPQPPCNPTLLKNLTIAPKHISIIFSPEAGGNCVYRMVEIEVHQGQEEWLKVKDKILETFLKHQHNYYQRRMEHIHMPASSNPLICSLQDKLSPLPQLHWFDTFDHPQLAADTFNRTVAVYCNTPIETGACFFVPLASLPEKVEPISIILDVNHFLLAKRKNTRNFCWPNINPFHKRIIQKHGLEGYSLMY